MERWSTFRLISHVKMGLVRSCSQLVFCITNQTTALSYQNRFKAAVKETTQNSHTCSLSWR